MESVPGRSRCTYSSTGNRSLFDLPYRAPVHRRLGEIHGRSGNLSAAAEHYRRFVDLWERADSSLQPQVAMVRTRIASLARN